MTHRSRILASAPTPRVDRDDRRMRHQRRCRRDRDRACVDLRLHPTSRNGRRSSRAATALRGRLGVQLVHEASPERVVYLQHGGACFSAETLRVRARPLQTSAEAGPSGKGGILTQRRAQPPADFSAVFVPYCTGDVFVGNTTREYAQASPSTTRGTPGSGPGLAIVRQIADSHGGRVEVESASAGARSGSLSSRPPMPRTPSIRR